MNPAASHSPTGSPGLSPVVAGTACCVVSALGYTAANVCMRQLASFRCDEMWVVAMKEVVTVAVVGPWLLYQAFRGLPVLPPWRTLAALALVGLAVQLGANLGMQWAYGKVGLAITISAMFGVMLTVSAVMGRLLLGERVSARSVAAIALLLLSLALLALGAGNAGRTVSDSIGTVSTPLLAALGVGAACLAGILYAVLTVTIRNTAGRGVPTTTIVFMITVMGVLSLGSWSVWRLGADQLLRTPPGQLAWMLAAGTCNLIAFLAITKGLQLTTVVHVNVLNASQVAMGAVAGIVFFQESRNPWVMLGVCMTILGVVLIGRPAGIRRRRRSWILDVAPAEQGVELMSNPGGAPREPRGTLELND